MLELKNIKYRAGAFQLGIIELTIERGEYFVLLGPTGSGKSLTLNLIAGFIELESGSINIHGNCVNKQPPEKRRIALVTQNVDLFPHLNVKDNILYSVRAEKNLVDEIAKRLNISQLFERKPSTLSGGEAQRVAIARALMCEPEILLLDEPLGSLDPSTRREIRNLLSEINEIKRTTFIHVTHDFEEAAALADRIGILFNGKLKQVGRVEEIFSAPVDAETAMFIGHRNVLHGKIVNIDGEQFFQVENVKFEIPQNKYCGNAVYTVNPDSIIVSVERMNSSARNSLKGRIINIEEAPSAVYVQIDVGVKLTSMITKKSAAELKIEVNKELWVTIKSTALHRI